MAASGSEIIAGLPQAPGPERERLLLDAAKDHDLHDWRAVELPTKAGLLTIVVSRLPFALGTPDDYFFPTLSCRGLAALADLFNARLLTARVSDLIYQKADQRLKPATQTPDALMAYTTRMRLHSTAVRAQLEGGWAKCGLVAGAGKDWVLTNQLRRGRAANYGWHSERAPYPAVTHGLRVLQPLGLAHNLEHVDYSQTCRLLARVARLDGEVIDVDRALKDPELSRALSHEGPLRYLDPREVAADTDPAPTQPAPAPPQDPAGHDFEGLPFIRARNFTPAQRTQPTVVVVHTMESAEKPGTARAVAKWFAGPSAPRASAHFCIGPDETIQCVALKDVAWGAPGANANGIHLEHVGRAAQTPEQWADAESRATLQRSAELTAKLCRRFGIPAVKLSVDELRAGKRGIVGHHDVSLAFRKSDHYDPGPKFPWGEYLAAVQKLLP